MVSELTTMGAAPLKAVQNDPTVGAAEKYGTVVNDWRRQPQIPSVLSFEITKILMLDPTLERGCGGSSPAKRISGFRLLLAIDYRCVMSMRGTAVIAPCRRAVVYAA